MVTFHGPARQVRSGGLGAFATRMGRMAMPLVKQFVMHVAQELGKKLINFCDQKYQPHKR